MDRALALRSDLHVDLAIIGAGAAGLFMASEALAQARRLRVIVLEPRRIGPNPRQWVFPARPGHALERFVSQRLDRVCVNGLEQTLRADRLDLVQAVDVQSAALDRLTSDSAGALEEGVRIDQIETRDKGFRLNTSLGPIHAAALTDTRPGPLAAVPDGCWTQVSWFARVRSVDITPGFSISRARVEGGGVVMDQSLVLPDGAALIESTGLCRPGDDGAAVRARLLDRVDALGAQADPVALKRAVFPLAPTPPAPAGPNGVVHAPAGAGGLRFGAGRAALRLARWARSEASRFARTGRLARPPVTSRTERKAARMLTAKLEEGPDAAARWINSALAQPDPDGVLRFLAAAPPRAAGLFSRRRGDIDA